MARVFAMYGAAILALATAACAPALRTPPTTAGEIDRSAEPAAEIEQSAAPALERARAAWARRPDLPSVQTAERVFLEAADDDQTATEPLLGAARAKAWLAEHEPEKAVRETLATSMVQTAQLCSARAPTLPDCDYWLGIALGIQAREKPSTAEAGLTQMVAALTRADKANPLVDEAGPARVLALVYLRAPGWPLGPGDPEAGLREARRAVAARPGYPPNRLALAEALEKNGMKDAAREELMHARDDARVAVAAGNVDAIDWVLEAGQALTR